MTRVFFPEVLVQMGLWPTPPTPQSEPLQIQPPAVVQYNLAFHKLGLYLLPFFFGIHYFSSEKSILQWIGIVTDRADGIQLKPDTGGCSFQRPNLNCSPTCKEMG